MTTRYGIFCFCFVIAGGGDVWQRRKAHPRRRRRNEQICRSNLNPSSSAYLGPRVSVAYPTLFSRPLRTSSELQSNTLFARSFHPPTPYSFQTTENVRYVRRRPRFGRCCNLCSRPQHPDASPRSGKYRSISPLPVASPPARILGLDLLPPTVRELCNQLLWRHWSLLCR